MGRLLHRRAVELQTVTQSTREGGQAVWPWAHSVFGFQFPHPKNEDRNSTYPTGSLRGLTQHREETLGWMSGGTRKPVVWLSLLNIFHLPLPFGVTDRHISFRWFSNEFIIKLQLQKSFGRNRQRPRSGSFEGPVCTQYQHRLGAHQTRTHTQMPTKVTSTSFDKSIYSQPFSYHHLPHLHTTSTLFFLCTLF